MAKQFRLKHRRSQCSTVQLDEQADLVNYGKQTSLEKQFLDLERSEQIEAELNDLKKSVQKDPAQTGQP
jgi:hypothetical protein